jgi:hypothetical protein
LDDRSCEAMMIRYSTQQKGYKLWEAKLKMMVDSRDVLFAEVPKASNDVTGEFLEEQLGNSSSAPDGSGQNLYENGENEDPISSQVCGGGDGSSQIVRESGETVPELSTNNGTSDEFVDCSGNSSGNIAGNDNSGVRKSGRVRRTSGPWWANCALISTTTDPTTIHQAMKRPDSTQWKDSMQCEYDSFMKHETWTPVLRPVNVNIIASKWVFKVKVVKNDADLDITKFESRLVA